jgi:hypothetical protein
MACGPASAKWQEWQRRMVRFQKGHQSIRQFCRTEGISEPSFYFWRKKLDQSPRPPSRFDSLAARFRPVRLLASPALSIRLPGGTQLDVSTSDPQLLQLTLQTLAQIDGQRAVEAKPW